MNTDTEASETSHLRRKRLSPRRSAVIGVGVAITIAAIAVVSVLTGNNVTNGKISSTNELVGQRMKNFSLGGLNGGEIRAPWESGRASVIVFFGSYCGPCKAEMPKIAKGAVRGSAQRLVSQS